MKRKSRGFCSCAKLAKGSPGAPGSPMGWFERFLLWLLPHFDIIKEIPSCEVCQGTGFDPRRTNPNLGDYDRICDNCAGQSVDHPHTVVYLRRFYVWRSSWIGMNFGDLYIHKIYRSDDDPDPHDHPWDFRTWVLTGSYTNETWAWEPFPKVWGEGPGMRVRLAWADEKLGPGSTRFRKRKHIHRVRLTDDKPAWTLIWTTGYHRVVRKGKAYADWYFITETGPVFWRDYLRLTDEAKAGAFDEAV